MVPVPGFQNCIDVYEWPNRKGAKPAITSSAMPEPWLQKKGDPPMDATALCESVGKRVCDRSEWIAACRGPDGSRFPWGARRPGQRNGHPCNTDKKWKKPDEALVARRDRKEIDRLDQSELSGTRKGCIAASGAYDMVGNAEEWARCPGIGEHGWCLMGRFWSSIVQCDQTVTVHHPSWHYYETGFRCCL